MTSNQGRKTIRFRKLAPGIRNQACEAGFTLIELVMTIVILGFVSVILVPFFTSLTHSPDPMIRQQAIALGQAMMDEILAKKWDNDTPSGGGPLNTTAESSRGTNPATAVASLGPDTGDGEAATVTNNRSSWDDVDDYDGLLETSGNLKDQNNSSIPITRYTREVSVGYLLSNTSTIVHDTALYASGTTDSKLIVVTVTSPLNEKFYFVAVACNF